jgi:hypothetical protein
MRLQREQEAPFRLEIILIGAVHAVRLKYRIVLRDPKDILAVENIVDTEGGSALPSVQRNGAPLVVPAGSLDSAIETRPDAHIFVASRANWDESLEDVPRRDEL